MRLQLEILLNPAARWGEDASILVAAGRGPPPARLPSWQRDPRLERNHGSWAAMAATTAPPAVPPATAGATLTLARKGVGGVATVGVMRQRRRGRDGRRDEGGDVRPPVVPGNDLDRPAIQVAAVFGPHPVVVPRVQPAPALNAPAHRHGVDGIHLCRILQGGANYH